MLSLFRIRPCSARESLDDSKVLAAAVGLVEDVEFLAGKSHAARAVGAVAARGALDEIGRTGAALTVVAVGTVVAAGAAQAM